MQPYLHREPSLKLQVREDKLGEELPPEARSELDLSLSKMERMVMDYIAASNDRVVIHQALKHLIVAGNALLFMGKDGIKNYPLNRYVVNRDGNGKRPRNSYKGIDKSRRTRL